MQDALAGVNRLIGQDAPHCIRERKGQFIRLGMAQADGKAALRVPVDQQHLSPSLRQPYP